MYTKESLNPNSSGRLKGTFLGAAAKLVSGTAAGQMVVILVSPILTRLYLPEEFGALGVYAAVLAIWVLVASLRYELAIPLTTSNGGAASILVLCLSLTVFTVVASGISVLFGGGSFLEWTGTETLGWIIWLLPLGVLVGAAYKALLYWAMRMSAFGTIARTRVWQGVCLAGFQVVFGLAGAGSGGLVVGHLAGFSAGLMTLARFAVRTAVPLHDRITAIRIRQLARRYSNFPKYSTWSDFANTLGSQLPLVIFASLFSPTTAGLYLLAHRVTNAPVALFSEAIGKVFMAASARARRSGSTADLALDVFSALLKSGSAPFLFLGILAPDLFSLVFGAEWAQAGIYLRWMAVWIWAVFVFVPLSTLFAVLELQRMDLVFQVTLLVARVLGLLVGALAGRAEIAIGLYSLACALTYVGFGSWVLGMAGVSFRKLLSIPAGELPYLALTGFVLFSVRALLVGEGVASPIDLTVLLILAAGFAIVPVVRNLHLFQRLGAVVT